MVATHGFYRVLDLAHILGKCFLTQAALMVDAISATTARVIWVLAMPGSNEGESWWSLRWAFVGPLGLQCPSNSGTIEMTSDVVGEKQSVRNQLHAKSKQLSVAQTNLSLGKDL